MKKVTKENSKPLNDIVESGIPGTYVPTEDGSYQKVDDMDADDLYEEAMAEIEIESIPEDDLEDDPDDTPTAKAYEVQYIPLYKGGSAEESKVKHLHRFYTVELMDDKYSGHKKLKKIELDNFAIINVLRDLGFYRYDQPNGSFEYVKIENNIITLLRDPQVIIDAFEDYVREIPTLYYRTGDAPEVVKKDDDKCIKYLKEAHVEITGEMLLQRIYKNIMYYFSSTLPRLRPTEPIKLLEDTKNSKYLFYNNGIVRISKDGIQFAKYSEINEYNRGEREMLITDVTDIMSAIRDENNGKYIWQSNILNRDFPSKYIDKDGKKLHQYDSDFEIFIDCICGLSNGLIEHNHKGKLFHQSNWRTDLNSQMQDGGVIPLKRKAALINIFGYLMHNNYECNMKSVMFIDMNKENIGKPAGGTGKGIIGKALSQMLNRSENDSKYIAVAGKNFDPEDERRYSEGDITTQLIHIEDIKSSFRFEGFFNDVTDGAVFRKMYQDKTRHRVKLMLSSNQPIDISAPSCKRRMVVFELDNFFNENKTPQDIFGKRFFESQWDATDWGMFDVFMIRCCYEYMLEKDKVGADGKVIGLRQPPLLNYTNTLLYSKLNEDFIVWFADKISEAKKFMIEKSFSKKGLYTEFADKYTEFQDERRYKRAFASWCKFYLQTMQIPSAEKRSTEDMLILYPREDPKITYIYK